MAGEFVGGGGRGFVMMVARRRGVRVRESLRALCGPSGSQYRIKI